MAHRCRADSSSDSAAISFTVTGSIVVEVKPAECLPVVCCHRGAKGFAGFAAAAGFFPDAPAADALADAPAADALADAPADDNAPSSFLSCAMMRLVASVWRTPSSAFAFAALSPSFTCENDASSRFEPSLGS